MSTKIENLVEGIAYDRTVMSWDIDGVLLKVKPSEQFLTAKAEWVIHATESFFQSPKPFLRGTRANISKRFLSKREPNPEAFAALAHLHNQKGIFLKRGIPFDIAVLSERPVGAHDLSVAQLSHDVNIGDVVDHWWENPIGQNPRELKGGVAAALIRKNVWQMHIEDKKGSAERILEAGGQVFLLKNAYNSTPNDEYNGRLVVVDSPMEAVSSFLDSISKWRD